MSDPILEGNILTEWKSHHQSQRYMNLLSDHCEKQLRLAMIAADAQKPSLPKILGHLQAYASLKTITNLITKDLENERRK